MIVRYIVEFYAGSEFGGWNQSSGCKARNPHCGYRVSPIEMTEEAFAFQEHRKKLERICDDILRQVVCHCGCYRHHGVSWMPEGSGEGLSVAVEILKKAGL